MRPLSSVLCEVAQTKNRDRVLWIVLDNASGPRTGGLSTDDVHVAMKYDSPMAIDQQGPAFFTECFRSSRYPPQMATASD